jgi:hypothetical protein
MDASSTRNNLYHPSFLPAYNTVEVVPVQQTPPPAYSVVDPGITKALLLPIVISMVVFMTSIVIILLQFGHKIDDDTKGRLRAMAPYLAIALCLSLVWGATYAVWRRVTLLQKWQEITRSSSQEGSFVQLMPPAYQQHV